MEYEYVALTWHRHPAIKDERFTTEYDRLRNDGWEVLRRAPLSAGRVGGACIMRRPKDEPYEKEEVVEYEYMALPPEDGYAGQCRAAVRNKELGDKGWKNWAMIPWYGSETAPVCVVRRELQPKDEPRMWTEEEIHEIAVRDALHDTELVKSILEDARTEADMQTAWNKELVKRNAELQAAIDRVVAVQQDTGKRLLRTWETVRRLLRPLATKEETNG